MNELRVVFWLVGGIVKLTYLIVRGVVRLVLRVLGIGAARRPSEEPAEPPPPARLATAAATRAPAERLAAELGAQAADARALEARCAAEPLCAPLLRSLREGVLPRLDAAQKEARRATGATDLAPLAATSAHLGALTRLLSGMADQRRDASLAELVDDADTLAEACYAPVVEFCRTNGLPLSSDRTATVFGDDCSPWLARVDDPTGLAVLHLPWQWLAEVQRWPAIAHEVGHDFYESVTGLDDELLRRHGLTAVVEDASLLDGRDGVQRRDLDRIVTRWRRELVADAFGVMMLGAAYVAATAALFARPDEPREPVTVAIDEGGRDYEVHPPAHVRVVAVCRLLARMGYGALGVTLEQRWRALHGEPTRLLLPVPEGWLRVPDEPFIELAVALTTSLYEEGFAALRGIPLSSVPGFDFGPREHEAALRARGAFLADAPVPVTDARLLIAGAVLAWAARPSEGARLLRAARQAVGKLPLRVPDEVEASSRAGSTRELVRDAFLLDLLLAPPVSSRFGRAPR